MATNVPVWQWALSSVLVPIVIGLGGAWLGHSLSLRKSRHEARLSVRRATYDQLLPALSDLVLSGERQIRFELHEFYGPEDEDRAHLKDEEWRDRYASAMECVRSVVARGQLAASKQVLDALNDYVKETASLMEDWNSGTSDFLDIYERDLAASKKVQARVQKAIPHEM